MPDLPDTPEDAYGISPGSPGGCPISDFSGMVPDGIFFSLERFMIHSHPQSDSHSEFMLVVGERTVRNKTTSDLTKPNWSSHLARFCSSPSHCEQALDLLEFMGCHQLIRIDNYLDFAG